MSYKRTNRQYTNEFRKEAIALFHNGHLKVAKVAENLGIPIGTLQQWINNDKTDGTKYLGKETLSPEAAEFSRLRKELADVRLERDILKKAVAIFSVPGK